VFVHLEQARVAQIEREERERELRAAVEEMEAKRLLQYEEYVSLAPFALHVFSPVNPLCGALLVVCEWS
jgi:hypothetical protein